MLALAIFWLRCTTSSFIPAPGSVTQWTSCFRISPVANVPRASPHARLVPTVTQLAHPACLLIFSTIAAALCIAPSNFTQTKVSGGVRPAALSVWTVLPTRCALLAKMPTWIIKIHATTPAQNRPIKMGMCARTVTKIAQFARVWANVHGVLLVSSYFRESV